MSVIDKPSGQNIKGGKQQRRSPKRITEGYLHNAGLYYLQRFAASKAHFKTVMLRKVRCSCMQHSDQNYDECVALVDLLAEKFEKTGLLDDEAYIKGMVGSLRRRGLSQKAICEKLRAKGIERDKTAQFLQAHDKEFAADGVEAEKRAALVFCRRKKMGPFANNNKNLTEEQSMGRLARAGFSYDTVRFVLDVDVDDAESKVLGRR